MFYTAKAADKPICQCISQSHPTTDVAGAASSNDRDEPGLSVPVEALLTNSVMSLFESTAFNDVHTASQCCKQQALTRYTYR